MHGAHMPRSRLESVHHPLFARLYQRIGASMDGAGAAEHRRRLLVGLDGRVVEVGAGTGLNFPHYPASVTEVIAVEPESYLRARAREAADRTALRVAIVDGTAGALPLDDASVDAGVASLVLCSVRDPATALAELHRVIRPGGDLRFYEHVVADDERWARRQRRMDPVWTRFAGGCHLDRDTSSVIARSGFEIIDCDRFLFQPCVLAELSAPHILGRARRP